jgi:hypothetical protein
MNKTHNLFVVTGLPDESLKLVSTRVGVDLGVYRMAPYGITIPPICSAVLLPK